MAVQYTFVTKWEIKAPLQEVWQSIYESVHWPGWWKGVLAVKEISKGNEDGIGGIRRYTWKSALPYELSFDMRLTHDDQFRMLRGEAFGELEGVGVWNFEEKDGVTYVQYNWDVTTNKSWMNLLSPILKPLFKYNHDVVMRWGAEGLAKKLNATLINC